MLAQPVRVPIDLGVVSGPGWRFERKLDGLRTIAVRDGGRIELWSRNRLSFDRRFPDLRRAIAAVPVPSFVLDAEIVVFEGGATSFQSLQSGAGGAVLVAFDLLHLLGRDTTGIPLEGRTELLRRTLEGAPGDGILQSEVLSGRLEELMESAAASGWEGLMAKRLGRPYRSGRSSDWRKIKLVVRQELVIGGWTDPSGRRTGFGALLVGYYDTAGRLHSAGRVGTGFDERTLHQVHAALRPLETAESPFVDLVRERGAHWARPELVAEIAFTEWTRGGKLRHPSFIALRDDVPASQVRREPV
jgi:bifunctional non-homologous end joining protein LigD